MKIIFTIITLMLLTTQINSQDYYYYQGKKILLQSRKDKFAVVLKSENYNETEIRNRITNLLNSGDKLTKAGKSVYLVELSLAMNLNELRIYGERLKSGCDYVKFTTEVFYGSSKSVIQIPTDRILVKLKQNSDENFLKSFCNLHDCVIKDTYLNERGFVVSTNQDDTRNALALSELFYSSGYFEYAEPDYIFPQKSLLLSVPNDPLYEKQWSIKNNGQLLQTGSPFYMYGDASTINGIPGADMNVEQAWDITTGSENVKIGIIDTGIDSLHPDFQLPGHLMPGYDAFNDVNSSAVDVGNHGTSTAGITSAVMNNSIGISGIAPTCPVMSICIFDINGSSSSLIIARAFDTARARGIDVLSNSWGGGTPQSVITEAIDNAAIYGRNGKGCIILFASGNDGRNPPIYPSVLPNVICVGASTPHDQAKAPGTGNQFWWGSNYGENEIGDIELVAPTNCPTLLSGGNYENNFWGTSASCPNAAGVAALVLSVNSEQTRSDVFNNILKGCDKIDNVPYDVQKQYGMWSSYYGYGRINAYNSVKLAAGEDVVPPVIVHTNVSSTSGTYPSIISADIRDQDGNSVPAEGEFQPKLIYKFKKGNSAWSGYDSVNAFASEGNTFRFKTPTAGWETQFRYYIKAYDNSGNSTTFPKHSPHNFWTCYYAVGNIVTEKKKIPPFSGADMGATLSNAVSFTNFNIVNAKFVIHMRHTYLDDEVIQIVSPLSDANNNRKCLFSTNGFDGDNIYGACVHDSSQNLWKDYAPPYADGNFKPEYNLRGLNGYSASGSWRILHFDRGLTDYAFFDSVFIILSKTSGALSPSVRFNQASDSIIDFGNVRFPEISEKEFYLKNCGTSSLNISSFVFEGEFASYFSIQNVPAAVVPPNDSTLFRVRLNTRTGNLSSSGIAGFENAVLKVITNDPSKPEFRISLQTNELLLHDPKVLYLNVLIEGFYNAELNQMNPDSVKVLLKNPTAPYETVDSSLALVDQNGSCNVYFLNSQDNTDYFVVVMHRNSIETWSSVTARFSNSIMNYDFTVSDSAAYGNNQILKGNRYCVFSGDVNTNGLIDAEDLGYVGNSAFQYQQGYLNEDLNGDMVIDASDNGIADNNVGLFITVITP